MSANSQGGQTRYWPGIEPLGRLDVRDDLFICALGFEDRCAAGPLRLRRRGYEAEHGLILKYDIHCRENDKNRAQLNQLVKEICGHRVSHLNYSVSEPSAFLENLRGALDEIDQNSPIRRISIDITSFSTAALVQVLGHLFDRVHFNAGTLRLIYTEAASYFPLKKDAKKRMPDPVYLSSGVKEVIILPGFAGVFFPGYPTLLVIFLGFDPIRARGAMNFLRPSKKIGLVGLPPRPGRKWRAAELRRRNQKIFADNDILMDVSTFDYTETIAVLDKVYETYAGEYNVAICPLGSKFQTLGVLLFAREHPQTKMIFPIPMKFHPLRYSSRYWSTSQILFKPEDVPPSCKV